MADIKDRAREYIAEHSEYSEVFGETFVAVDTFTAMVEFAEQETKDLEQKLETERNSRIALVKLFIKSLMLLHIILKIKHTKMFLFNIQ